MAEEKKRGFGALEKRIHDMEAEDAKREREASQEGEAEVPRKEPGEKKTEGPKK